MPARKKPKKTLKEIVENHDELMKGKEILPDSQERFLKALDKAAKPKK